MTRKNDTTESFTVEALKDMVTQGKAGSDWKRASEVPLPDGSDPDDAMDDIDWRTVKLSMPRRKSQMTLRIDTDVVEFFKDQGRGYQTRINAILRSYVDQIRHRHS